MPLESIPLLLLGILVVQFMIWWGQPFVSVYRRLLEASNNILERLDHISATMDRMADQLDDANDELHTVNRHLKAQLPEETFEAWLDKDDR